MIQMTLDLESTDDLDAGDRFASFRGWESDEERFAYGSVAGRGIPVLSPTQPEGARPLPRRPPPAVLPRVDRAAGRRRTNG